MGLNAYIQRCSILQLFIDLLVDHGFSREVTRVRFYFLLPTSKDFRGSLPTKPVCVYCVLYRLIMINVMVIVMDKMKITVILESFLSNSVTMEHRLYQQLNFPTNCCTKSL